MLYGIINGEKVSPQKGLNAICQDCGNELISKCGLINIWHFAHVSGSECSSKPETEWHRKWKSYFKKELVEVKMIGCRADVCIGNTILEFQNSSITAEEIESRERIHLDNGKRTVWIVNGEDFSDRVEFNKGKYGGYMMRMKHPRKHIFHMKTALIDFGTEVVLIKKKYSYKNYLIQRFGPKLYFIFDSFGKHLNREVIIDPRKQ